jgi:pimeloyl-ACP methyl ester carboxylesterase
MTSIFDFFDPSRFQHMPKPQKDAVETTRRTLQGMQAEIQSGAQTSGILSTSATRHGRRIVDTHTSRARTALEQGTQLGHALRKSATAGHLFSDWAAYLRDASERAVLTVDTLRKRGDIFLEHEAAGCPPVLAYEHELVMDGRDLPYPSNYFLLRILPPAGVTIDAQRRPYIVIDPRAGHGPGIGGFKADSQVGVALRAGHPVYFVAFRREPEPGQYLSYVTRSEAAFVREVMRRHPQASKPVVIGNCQGGWATLLLAATNPDLTGPIVINGAPVSPWSGKVGENPMRYNAGVLGGTWIPMFLSDVGNGKFDGAHLVQNFEMLNPGRTLFRKYTDLFRDIDQGDAAFLEFEKWWGGFFLLNKAEIRWIVEQLFVGNRLIKNEARLEPGRPVDLKAIRAPIIVFASHGDNITPPQQALNWIADTYADVAEIRIRGQRIIYMVHDQVGHLGIFVSSQIANKEHSEMGSTLQTIEALAPGLYEMRIADITEENGKPHFTVDFAERTLDDIRALDDGHQDERPFAAVARASEIQAQMYDAWVRPWVNAITHTAAEACPAPPAPDPCAHVFHNPAMKLVPVAKSAAGESPPTTPSSPPRRCGCRHRASHRLVRDTRDMGFERRFATGHHKCVHLAPRPAPSRATTSCAPCQVTRRCGHGAGRLCRSRDPHAGFAEEPRPGARPAGALQPCDTGQPFPLQGGSGVPVIHQQTLIATYDPDRAIKPCPLLPDPSSVLPASGAVHPRCVRMCPRPWPAARMRRA